MNKFSIHFKKTVKSDYIFQIIGPIFQIISIPKSNSLLDFITYTKNLLNDSKETIGVISSLQGWKLTLLEPYIIDLLNNQFIDNSTKKNESDQKTFFKRQIQSDTSIEIPESVGVQLSILFSLSNIVEKMNSVEKIARDIRSMGSEELYYWYSKIFCDSNHEPGLNALKILIQVE